MKKLVLEKDVVARINNGQMNQLRGGAGTYDLSALTVCPSDGCTVAWETCISCDATCKGHTCDGGVTCGGITCAGATATRTHVMVWNCVTLIKYHKVCAMRIPCF